MLWLKSLLIFAVSSLVLAAGDPFVGTWRLDVEKSNVAATVKGGTTTYESLGDGYVYDAKIVFANSNVGHLHGFVRFDGTVNEAQVDGRAVNSLAKKLDENSYKLMIADEETGDITNIFQYVVQGNTLTFTWLRRDQHPALVLVYERE